MRCALDYNLKEIVLAVFLSSFIAGGVTALANSVAANKIGNGAVSINPANKGDRLSQGPKPYRQEKELSATGSIRPKRIPLGCDPVVSPIAEPSLAHIFKRCIV